MTFNLFFSSLYGVYQVHVTFHNLPQELNKIINSFVESTFLKDFAPDINVYNGSYVYNGFYFWKDEFVLMENIILPQHLGNVIIGFYSTTDIEFDLFLWNGQYVGRQTLIAGKLTVPFCNVIINGKRLVNYGYIKVRNISSPSRTIFIFSSNGYFKENESYYSVISSDDKCLIYSMGTSLVLERQLNAKDRYKIIPTLELNMYL